MKNGNYHTHTYRCKHASGDVSDYAAKAVAAGLEVLGISDHTPLLDGRWHTIRMGIEELDSYERAIDEAIQKYPSIEILKGMECDWVKEYKNFFLEELKDKRKYTYLIGAIHNFKIDGKWTICYSPEAFGHIKEYTDLAVEMIESEVFDFIAHPDLFGLFCPKWDNEATAAAKAICQAAETYKTPLEINGYGFRKPKIETEDGIRNAYPVEKFWEIATDYNIKVICNSDAHRPEDVTASIEDCMKIVSKYKLSLWEPDFTG